MQVERVCW